METLEVFIRMVFFAFKSVIFPLQNWIFWNFISLSGKVFLKIWILLVLLFEP